MGVGGKTGWSEGFKVQVFHTILQMQSTKWSSKIEASHWGIFVFQNTRWQCICLALQTKITSWLPSILQQVNIFVCHHVAVTQGRVRDMTILSVVKGGRGLRAETGMVGGADFEALSSFLLGFGLQGLSNTSPTQLQSF